MILKYRQELQYPEQGKSKTGNGKAGMLTPEEKEQNRAMQRAPARSQMELNVRLICQLVTLEENHSEPPLSPPQNQD